ncbi:MAG: hypothetical protein Q9170_007641 [Blastenia crenularia]
MADLVREVEKVLKDQREALRKTDGDGKERQGTKQEQRPPKSQANSTTSQYHPFLYGHRAIELGEINFRYDENLRICYYGASTVLDMLKLECD